MVRRSHLHTHPFFIVLFLFHTSYYCLYFRSGSHGHCCSKAFVHRSCNGCMGERKVIMLAFALRAIHILLCRFANRKSMVFARVSVSAIVEMFNHVAAIKVTTAGTY